MSEEHRALMWMLNGETGLSSIAIARRMLGVPPREGHHRHHDIFHPLDPADMRRCLLLLDWIPGWAGRIDEMADVSPQWAKLVAKWGEIEATLLEEMHRADGMAPKTYAMMRAVLES